MNLNWISFLEFHICHVFDISLFDNVKCIISHSRYRSSTSSIAKFNIFNQLTFASYEKDCRHNLWKQSVSLTNEPPTHHPSCQSVDQWASSSYPYTNYPLYAYLLTMPVFTSMYLCILLKVWIPSKCGKGKKSFWNGTLFLPIPQIFVYSNIFLHSKKSFQICCNKIIYFNRYFLKHSLQK